MRRKPNPRILAQYNYYVERDRPLGKELDWEDLGFTHDFVGKPDPDMVVVYARDEEGRILNVHIPLDRMREVLAEYDEFLAKYGEAKDEEGS